MLVSDGPAAGMEEEEVGEEEEEKECQPWQKNRMI